MMRRFFICLLLLLLLVSGSFAESLRYGMKGEEVVRLQAALIDLGYLEGKADGVFGAKTERAVRNFQSASKLHVDGVAGDKTRAALDRQTNTLSGSGLFDGDYSVIDGKSDPARVRKLQNALIAVNYLNASADGIFGSVTQAAVTAFQKEQGLKKDGVAGKKTLKALESAVASGCRRETAPESAEPAEPASESKGKAEAPDKKSVELLHWFDDIKPTLKKRARLTVYEPVSKLSWTVVVYSKSRHCNVEPLTAADTQNMLKAFGNVNTWDLKGVYVKLPDGRWTVGATHTAPYGKYSITKNGFDGVTSIHFFRDMDECQQNDPNFGVTNQKKIRAFWKKLTGVTVK